MHRQLGVLSVLGLLAWPFFVSATAHAEPLPAQRQHELAQSALNAFDQAVALAKSDPPAATELYRQAVGAYQALADSGVRNAALEYNLANAYFRLKDLGHAILHYRRAERLAPTDPLVSANLRYARERVEPFITPSGERQLLAKLLFWNRSLSIERRFWIAALGSFVGWAALLAWLRWRRAPLALTAGLGIVLGLANAGSVAWQIRDETQSPPAVVVAENQTLRQGRGLSYEPAIKQPLGAGVELRILAERGDWVEVRLPDDNTGWLPGSVVERISG